MCRFWFLPLRCQKVVNMVEEIARFFGRAGFLTVEEHDEICAMTSHLPHILSNCFLSAVLSHREDLPQYADRFFRRLGENRGSSPRMWRDIFITNRDKILKTIGLFQRT